MYELNNNSLLVRFSSIDGSQQVVVPANNVSGILFMEHYPHQRVIREHISFPTILRTFFWPRIAEDVYETVRQCDVSASNCTAEKRKTNPLKLFPTNGPL
jgi:hypothetical protein